jgi:hypothetical protein
MSDFVEDFAVIAIFVVAWIVATEYLGVLLGGALWVVALLAALTRVHQ